MLICLKKFSTELKYCLLEFTNVADYSEKFTRKLRMNRDRNYYNFNLYISPLRKIY